MREKKKQRFVSATAFGIFSAFYSGKPLRYIIQRLIFVSLRLIGEKLPINFLYNSIEQQRNRIVRTNNPTRNAMIIAIEMR